MLWTRRPKVSAQELQRELEAQYESWRDQADRECRPESASGGESSFGALVEEVEANSLERSRMRASG